MDQKIIIGINAGIVASMATAFIWVGSISSDVEGLKEESKELTKVEEIVQENRVTAARVEAQQQATRRDLSRIEQSINRILNKLEEEEEE